MIALQAQINPHFRYNTFDSIRWLIKADDRDSAMQILEDLSSFLRYCSRSDDSVVTIGEEIQSA